jgi:hypothetical protein
MSGVERECRTSGVETKPRMQPGWLVDRFTRLGVLGRGVKQAGHLRDVLINCSMQRAGV